MHDPLFCEKLEESGTRDPEIKIYTIEYSRILIIIEHHNRPRAEKISFLFFSLYFFIFLIDKSLASEGKSAVKINTCNLPAKKSFFRPFL